MAQALLLILEWKSPTSTIPPTTTGTRGGRSNNHNAENMTTIIDEQNILRLVESIFSPPMTSSNNYSSSSSSQVMMTRIMHASSIHLFIHLCLVRDERLKRVLKQAKVVSLMKVFMKSANGDYGEVQNNYHHHYGLSMILLNCITTYPQCRRLLYQIIVDVNNNEGEDSSIENNNGYNNLGSFLNSILEQGKDVRFMFHQSFHEFCLFIIPCPHSASVCVYI